MKRIVSLVLAISMVLSMFVSALAATRTFEDIDGTKYAGAVEALVELGVIDGLPDGTYGPEKEVTRAQLAKMLVICLGLGDSVEALEGRTVFTDVDESHWASGYINAAVQSKVIAGYPDGTFKPEKNVSYAEAVTMVIRSLGYGNVVDTEGTWPTAYMLKAVELELLDDMGSPKAGEAALRGNVAILLWNMLRTPMWKITAESEGDGMTSMASSLMLNVKFPDYRYEEEAYITDVTVADGEATVELSDEDGDFIAEAKVEDVDLPRLVLGMRVSTLIKDYKDKEDATFLTLTPEYTLVEGTVTDVTENDSGDVIEIEIDEVEYKISGALAEAVAEDDYVVAEVNGKKVNNYGWVSTTGTGANAVTTVADVAVLKVLEDSAKEVEKIKSIESKIDEEALVIIDGVWSTRDDIEVGDIYTEITDAGESYYMVTRERIEGTFESYTVVKGDTDDYYLVVDGEEYRAMPDDFKAYEDEENDKEVDKTILFSKTEKDNKYLDQDVELVLNYLGQVFEMNFGEVSDLEADGDFYAVMSNGVWFSSTSSGKQYHIALAGADGEEETYNFVKSTAIGDIPEVLAEELVYASGDPVFVWANINDDGEVKALEVLTDGLTSGDGNYLGDYAFVAFSGEGLTDDNYLETSDDKYKVTDSTVVYTVTPIEDEDDETKIIGFEIEVSEGTEALEGVTAGLIAYDTTSSSKRAKYVFVAEDAKSQDLYFGLVPEDAVRLVRGVEYVTIDGTEYEIDEDSEEFVEGQLVAYTVNNDKAKLYAAYKTTDLDGAAIVTEIDDIFVTFTVSGDVADELAALGFVAGENVIDVTLEDIEEAFEDAKFVRGSAYADKDNKVVFEADVEDLGEGLAEVSFKKGDRVSVKLDSNNKVDIVTIIDGFDYDDVIEDGAYVPEEA